MYAVGSSRASLDAFARRCRSAKKIMAIITARPAIAAPIPIPALAPVDNPEEDESDESDELGEPDWGC
jgi:hypothetical protein